MIYTDKMIWIYHKSSRALDVVFKLIVLSEQQLKKAQSAVCEMLISAC